MVMNYSFCSSDQHNEFNGERLSHKEDSYQKRVNLMAWIVKSMKPTCLWRRKKRQKQNNERHQQLKIGKEKTLEEWLLRSPTMDNGGDQNYGFHNSDYFPSIARKSAYFSESKEHGVSLEKLLNGDYKPESVDYCVSLESLLKDEKGYVREIGFSSINRSQSCKGKKRVSFRFPEVSDTIILHVPEVNMKD